MNSKNILAVIILFSMAIYGCKEEEVKVDLTTSLVGTYSGEFTWTTNLEVKKGNGIITIKKIDETHVEITDDFGLYHFDFVEVVERDLRDGSINFSQIVKNPNSNDKYFGWFYAYGNRNENKLYITFNGIYFTGNFIR